MFYYTIPTTLCDNNLKIKQLEIAGLSVYPAIILLLSCYLFRSEVIAAEALDAAVRPVEFLNGLTKNLQIGHVAGLQVAGELILNVLHLPKALLFVNL